MDTSQYLNHISVDCVILGFHEQELKVLLLKLKQSDIWALPGGFVEKHNPLDDEAARVLEKRTGLTNIFLHQFKVFGNPDRSQGDLLDAWQSSSLISLEESNWLKQRFISIGYYALVEFSLVKKPRPDHFSERCEWISINELPLLAFDHKNILQEAHTHLKKELQHQPIGLNLLPEEFTMPELQTLYETILGRKLDRRNFRRKMIAYGILTDTGQKRTGLGHRAPILYRFDQKAYKQALDTGLQGGF